MRSDERLGFARQAYQRAVAQARTRSTPRSWVRLLTAAKNLGAAKRDRERERAHWRGDNPPAAATPSAHAAASPRPPVPITPPPREGSQRPDAAVVVTRMPALPAAELRSSLERRLELAREWERSRLLQAQSRRLIAQAQELRAIIGELAARWPYKLAGRDFSRTSRALPDR